MELIRINRQKLKIMLTPSDMTHYHLDSQELERNFGQTRGAFRRFLEDLRRQTDFEFDDRRISIQFFPSREGGCELFLSSLTPLGGEAEEEKKRPQGSLPVARLPSKGVGVSREVAFRLNTMELLLRVCSRLATVGYIGASRLGRTRAAFTIFCCKCPPPPCSRFPTSLPSFRNTASPKTPPCSASTSRSTVI